MKPQSQLWSINLLQVKGTEVRLHISLVLAAAWILFEGWSAPEFLPQSTILLGCGLFSLLLHESAQTLAALALKVRVKEVVLYPYGGVAHYQGETTPRAAILIGLSGIIMSAFLATLCFSFLDRPTALDHALIQRLFILNAALAGVSLLPISSLDGGKIFRAILTASGRLDRGRFSSLVSVCAAAVLCATVFYFGSFAPSALAVFVFVEAFQEHLYQKTRPLTESFKAADITVPFENLAVFSHGTTVAQAYQIVLHSFQTVFPIDHNGEVLGVVDREVIIQHMAVDPLTFVTGLMTRDVPRITPQTPLHEVFDLVQLEDQPCLLVLDNSQLVGLIFKDRLFEFLFVQSVRKKMESEDDYQDPL